MNVTFYLNERDEEAIKALDKLAKLHRESKLELTVIPTSGPVAMWISRHKAGWSAMGLYEVKRDVQRILDIIQEDLKNG